MKENKKIEEKKVNIDNKYEESIESKLQFLSDEVLKIQESLIRHFPKSTMVDTTGQRSYSLQRL